MRNHIEHLSLNSVQHLQLLLDRWVYGFYAPQLTVDFPWCSAPLLVVPIGGSYLVVKSSYRETPENGLPYYALTIAVEEEPEGIPLKHRKDGGRQFDYPTSSFRISEPKTRVSSIRVLEAIETGTSELLEFDYGFILDFDDGRSVVVSAERSISEYVQITSDPRVLTYLLDEFRTRLRFPS